MTDTKWTPGPWEFFEGEDNEYHGKIRDDILGTIVANDWHIARIWDFNDADNAATEECQANAHLIAAAPELYEALEANMQLVHALTGATDDLANNILDLGNKALAKARGETE